jgi:hypothetical protein
MADFIKDVAKFSNDAICLAINTVFENNSDEKQQFEEHLRAMNNILKKPPKRQRPHGRPTAESRDSKLFRDSILPQIQTKVAEYEQYILNHDNDFPMNLDNPSAPIDSMDLASLKQAHAMVIEEETTATALHQVVAY